MENLKTYLIVNTILKSESVTMDFKEIFEREQFLKLVRDGMIKKEEEKDEL